MDKERIHPETRISRVHLNVADLERALQFYQEGLGLELIGREDGTARLGAGGEEFLTLTEAPGHERNPRETGLYHFAVLVPSRPALALVLQHLVELKVPLGGFADHLVSEAIYLSDPDENGIEIYRDRPREDWQITPTGEIQMATDPIDIKGIAGELEKHPSKWEGMDPGTQLGHIHLQVSSLRDSEDFYARVLGFDITARNYPGARFVSAGGYHHHIGMNTWNSAGALPPVHGSIGLVNYVILLPNEQELAKVVKRVQSAGVEIEDSGEGYAIHDPSQNAILIAAPAK